MLEQAQLEFSDETLDWVVQVETHELAQPLHPVPERVAVDVHLFRGEGHVSERVEESSEGLDVGGAALGIVAGQRGHLAVLEMRPEGLDLGQLQQEGVCSATSGAGLWRGCGRGRGQGSSAPQ
jgi:hypothetical protein